MARAPTQSTQDTQAADGKHGIATLTKLIAHQERGCAGEVAALKKAIGNIVKLDTLRGRSIDCAEDLAHYLEPLVGRDFGIWLSEQRAAGRALFASQTEE